MNIELVLHSYDVFLLLNQRFGRLFPPEDLEKLADIKMCYCCKTLILMQLKQIPIVEGIFPHYLSIILLCL